MTTTKNNEHKKLNFSSEREQSQVCLNSAEHEKNQGRKVLNVPNLRFKEFQGEWVRMRLDAFTERVMRKNKNNKSKLPLTISAQYGLVDQITFFNKVIASTDMSNYYLLKKGEFAYNKSYSSDYPWGAVKRLDNYEQGALSSLYICFAPQDNVVSDFILQYFESPKWHKGVSEIAVEGARNHGLLNVSVQDFFHTYHYVPKDKKEQIKVAELLMLLDERIATQNKIIEDLKKLKSAIIEMEYTPNTKTTSHIGNVIEQIFKRNKNNAIQNVLSVSNRQGFIKQSDQFENRNVASEDTSNYKIVEKNDFAFNPARINVGSIARLTTFEKGIVSPMYICFRTQENVAPEYIDSFFESKHFYCEIQKRLEGSVRQCLSFEGLCNIPFSLPSLEMQQRIGKRLFTLGQKIKMETDLLELLNKQKQYLLRQMFI